MKYGAQHGPRAALLESADVDKQPLPQPASCRPQLTQIAPLEPPSPAVGEMCTGKGKTPAGS